MIPLIEEHRAALGELCRQYGVARLEVFGSLATGDFNVATSDVDFLVEFRPEMGLSPFRQYFDLLLERWSGSWAAKSISSRSRPCATRTSSGRWSAPGGWSMRPRTPKLLEDIRVAASFILARTPRPDSRGV